MIISRRSKSRASRNNYRCTELAISYQDSDTKKEKEQLFYELTADVEKMMYYVSYQKIGSDKRLIQEDVVQEMRILLLKTLGTWDRKLGSSFSTFYMTALKFNPYKGSQRTLDCLSEHGTRTEHDDVLPLEAKDETNYSHKYQMQHDGKKILRIMKKLIGVRNSRMMYQHLGLELDSVVLGKEYNMSYQAVLNIKNKALFLLRRNQDIKRMIHEYSK